MGSNEAANDVFPVELVEQRLLRLQRIDSC